MNRTLKNTCLSLTFSLFSTVSFADQYPESLLYSAPVKVADGVYSAIGATEYYTYENAGHNNNLSFVIGDEAVLVVNGSSSYLLARALHEEIKKLTDLPIKYVVDENGQSHAALGNSYWREQGSTVYAHVDAAHEIEERGHRGLESLQAILKERADGSEVMMPDEIFEDEVSFDLGGIEVIARYLGPAHSPGDVTVLVPDRNVVIAGDMAFHQRMLPVFPDTDTAAWLETWYEVFTPLAQDKIIVPGHGVPTNFTEVDTYTRGYLEYVRGEIAKLLDEGGMLEDAYSIDQTPYAHLDTYEELAARNAGRIFEAMEFE